MINVIIKECNKKEISNLIFKLYINNNFRIYFTYIVNFKLMFSEI